MKALISQILLTILLSKCMEISLDNLYVDTGDKRVNRKPSVLIQANFFNTDTKGTELSVRFTEVSVL